MTTDKTENRYIVDETHPLYKPTTGRVFTDLSKDNRLPTEEECIPQGIKWEDAKDVTELVKKAARELMGLCDGMHLMVEGTYNEDDSIISHNSLSLEGGIHQMSHVLRDKSLELLKLVSKLEDLKLKA